MANIKHILPFHGVRRRILPRWMHFVLRFAGGYNIIAGLSMILLYHEGFKLLGVEKPDFNMPIQLVGVLVAVFGVGYLWADRDPIRNANVVLLGMLSKGLGPIVSFLYIAQGALPPIMIVILFFADLIYLVPFWKIYRKIVSIELERDKALPMTMKRVRSRAA